MGESMREIILDCSGIANKRQLHEALKAALCLPEWYGKNLDALFDCLTELDDETHLILKNWDHDAAFACGFESVFTDAAAENEAFRYTIA